jgi:hypothetical protein
MIQSNQEIRHFNSYHIECDNVRFFIYNPGAGLLICICWGSKHEQFPQVKLGLKVKDAGEKYLFNNRLLCKRRSRMLQKMAMSHIHLTGMYRYIGDVHTWYVWMDREGNICYPLMRLNEENTTVLINNIAMHRRQR